MSARDFPGSDVLFAEAVARMRAQFLAPPPHVDTADWAAQYRHIAKGPERGQWRNERTPYLVEPMRCASSHTPYERVVLWFATQLGKSEVLYNSVMQRIHTDPQDMMMVQPTLQDAKDHSAERFLPTIMQTPVMRGKVAMRKSRDESTSWRSRSIQGGFTVFFAGANSAASLASKPLGFAVADEVDKWPADVDNEGPPLGLLEERMSNFSRRKLIIASTCNIKGQSVIEREYLASDRRQYHVPCPHCGEAQVLVWGESEEYGIKWLKTESGKARPETAVYVCRHCGFAIEEHTKGDMLAQGIWIAQAPGASLGKSAGFWLNKLYSPLGWTSWVRLVGEWEAAQETRRAGDSAPLKKFLNSSLAETWEEVGTGADSRALAVRAEDYRLGTVPRGGLMLTAGVDTQPDRLEMRTWAWGRGEESWLVGRHIIYGDPNLDEGTPGSPWTTLTEIRRTPIAHQSGALLRIDATCVDTGGHNTHAVYNYCRSHQHERVLAIKGSSKYDGPVLGRPSIVDVNHRGRSLKHGVKLWHIGTDTAKHLLYGRMRITSVGPGYVHVPKELVSTDEFEQMTAARLMPVVVQGKGSLRWLTPKGKREEGGDCMVYAYAAACHLGIQTFREPSWARRELAVEPQEQDLFLGGAANITAATESTPDLPDLPVAASNKPADRRSIFEIAYGA
ncbi:MAG: phage terminase large subunit family protein [Burkholderiaceae bacterium]|nr:phage terminase large subunit family protein [Burkholderiaceae bacterium]